VLTSMTKSSLHTCFSFFNGVFGSLSLVPSKILVKRLLYLMDAKCSENSPSGSKPLNSYPSFKLNGVSISDISIKWVEFLTIVSATWKGIGINCFFLFLSNRRDQCWNTERGGQSI
jgi:hypothetical protein